MLRARANGVPSDQWPRSFIDREPGRFQGRSWYREETTGAKVDISTEPPPT
jgi:hypothetical protein